MATVAPSLDLYKQLYYYSYLVTAIAVAAWLLIRVQRLLLGIL
jgi:hypothetical protein